MSSQGRENKKYRKQVSSEGNHVSSYRLNHTYATEYWKSGLKGLNTDVHIGLSNKYCANHWSLTIVFLRSRVEPDYVYNIVTKVLMYSMDNTG